MSFWYLNSPLFYVNIFQSQQQQQQHQGVSSSSGGRSSSSSDMLLANGSLPQQHAQQLMSVSAVGCVSGSGSGAACASPQPLLLQQGPSTSSTGKMLNVPSSNSSTATDSTNSQQWTSSQQYQHFLLKPQVSSTGPSTSTSTVVTGANPHGQVKNLANHENVSNTFRRTLKHVRPSPPRTPKFGLQYKLRVKESKLNSLCIGFVSWLVWNGMTCGLLK
jgi:hypothetical protein